MADALKVTFTWFEFFWIFLLIDKLEKMFQVQ